MTEGTFYKFSYPATTLLFLDSNSYNGDTLYYNYGNADITEDDFIGISNTTGIPGESGSSLIKVKNNQDYTSYGVLTFSNDLLHSRLKNWQYYAFEHIIHNDIASGITQQLSPYDLRVFPNPSPGLFHIWSTDMMSIKKYSVFDYRGRLIFSDDDPDPNYLLDLTEQKQGIYYLRIISGNFSSTKKLIKTGN